MVVSTKCLANFFLTKLTTGLLATRLRGARRRGREGEHLAVLGWVRSTPARKGGNGSSAFGGGTWGDWDPRWGKPHKVFVVMGLWGLLGSGVFGALWREA